MADSMEKISSLCKRRGFIYPSSDIYGGIAGFWDYGPLGTELKRNIKNEWWKTMVYMRDDVVGIDASIVMNPEVWKASGHLDAFTNPLIECKVCHTRVRADQEEEIKRHQAEGHKKEGKSIEVSWTEPKKFNLMTEVLLGVTEPKMTAYLRGEITQGVFVNFQNVVSSNRVKIPFGIAQIGKAFRNEVTPGNFTFRSREFEQMELEYFVAPHEREAQQTFDDFKRLRKEWYISLGIRKENLRLRDHESEERAHYAKAATDIEYNSPFGWKEFEGIHHRGDWDLSRHKLMYKDPEKNQEYTPWVIETSGGVDRATLFFLLDAYHEEDLHARLDLAKQVGKSGTRVVLKLNPKLAPFKVAVFPLVANKPELIKKAKDVYEMFKSHEIRVAWDARGNIGKRYLSQDEIGTPWCVTIDYTTLENDTVTIRNRDTTKQERLKIHDLVAYVQKSLVV